MIPDWKRLAPHRPLHVGAAEYVAPPTAGGQAIADWILAGGATVLVGGPVGIGKSTELRKAAQALQSQRVACLVQLDRLHRNMRSIRADDVQLLIAGVVAELALLVFGLDLSDPLRELLVGQRLIDSEYLRKTGGGGLHASPETVLDAVLQEVSRLSTQGAICLLIDGLEKTGQDNGPEVFDALGRLPEWIDLAVVVPWHAAFGPRSELTVRAGERLVSLRAAPAGPGPQGKAGREFMQRVLMTRLGLSAGQVMGPEGVATVPHFPETVTQAAEHSGGVPRTFLQLMADAATFARLRRGGDWPTTDDMGTARAEQVDFMRRLLLPGDRDLIVAADGTTGTEIELGSRIRLLAHGVLLEREEGDQVVLRPHPLVLPVLGKGNG